MLCEICLQEISIGDDDREHCGCEEECPCGCGGDDLHCVYSAQQPRALDGVCTCDPAPEENDQGVGKWVCVSCGKPRQ